MVDRSLVVICLNEVRLNDTLLGKPPRLNDLCVQELDEALSERVSGEGWFGWWGVIRRGF